MALRRGEAFLWGSRFVFPSTESEDATKEFDRYVDAGCALRSVGTKLRGRTRKGSVSKMALIVATKQDGSVKRRVVVDLRRSGADRNSVCPERIALPRAADAIRDLQMLGSVRSGAMAGDGGCLHALVGAFTVTRSTRKRAAPVADWRRQRILQGLPSSRLFIPQVYLDYPLCCLCARADK